MDKTICHFDSDSHVYTIGGASVPSVTGLLSEFGIVNTQWYNLQASTRGTHVHTATVYHDEGDLDYSGLDPIVKPFMDAYIRFKKECPFVQYTLTEKSLFDPVNLFAGTLDRYGTIDGRVILLDIKSGSFPSWVAIQLAGYRKLLVSNGYPTPQEYYALVLKADGSYSFPKIPTIDIMDGTKTFDAFLRIKAEQRKYFK